MNPIILIPARLDSQRLPRKSLADIAGKPMVVHVMERARAAAIGPVFVACCGSEIADCVTAAGGQAIITDPTLPSGTDRIYAALQQIDPKEKYDCIINLQGDLPTISPLAIRRVLDPLQDSSVDIATLGVPYEDPEDLTSPHKVKMALTLSSENIGRVHYFSRSPLPYQAITYYFHIGIYAYRRQALKDFVKAPPSLLERCESLEQLRALEMGQRIGVALVDEMPQSVDIYNDLEVVKEFFATQ